MKRRNTSLSNVRKARREAAQPVRPVVNPDWKVGGLDSSNPGYDGHEWRRNHATTCECWVAPAQTPR